MKPVQYFSKEYLDRCRDASPDQIAQFLEDYKYIVGGRRDSSKLISIKIPESLLRNFRMKAHLTGIPYQTQIKKLMESWIKGV